MRGRAWTVEEIALLEREYKTCFLADIGKRVHRSRSSVKAKMRELGLAKQPGRPQPPRPEPAAEPEINIRIVPIGKNEQIPPMPGLFEHLVSMAGSMDSEIVSPNARHRECIARLEIVGPTIQEMHKQRISGHKIAKALDLPYSTVYGHLKAIRAAA